MAITNNQMKIVLSLKDEATRRLKQFQAQNKKIGAALRKNWLLVAAAITAAVLVLKKFIDSMIAAGKELIRVSNIVEQLKVRLKVLLKSTEKGNLLFKNMAELASRVPKTYEDIMSAATDLAAVVRNGVKDVTELMPIIVDISAATGITVRDVTSQMIRMYSAGAAAADMFRERGVLAALGFQAGVSVTAEETINRIVQQWKDGTGKFVGASKELATSFTGMVSILQDAWFQFKVDVGKPLFEKVKKDLDGVLELIKMSKEEGGKYGEVIEQVAKFFSDAFDNAKNFAKALIIGAAQIKDAWNEVLLLLQKVQNSITRIEKFTLQATKVTREMLFRNTDFFDLAIFEREIKLREGLKREKELQKEATRDFSIELDKRLKAFEEFFNEARHIAEVNVAFEGAGGAPPVGSPFIGAQVEKKEGGVPGGGQAGGDIFTTIKDNAIKALQEIGTLGDQISKVIMGAIDTFSKGFGDAVAQMIVFGKNFKDSMKKVLLNMAADFISYTVEIITKWLLLQTLSGTLLASAVTASVAAANAVAAAWATAAAFVNAATFGAGATAGSAALIAITGLAKGLAAIPALAEGGIATRPTLALVGDRGPEAIIPLDRGRGVGDIIINIDRVDARDEEDIDNLTEEISTRLAFETDRIR